MIRIKQIDAGELQAFITGVLGGGSFANALTGYINGSGYFGPYIVYSSGGAQTIYGQKDFALSPGVPYSGGSGTAPSKKYVDDKFITETGNLYSIIDPLFVKTSGNSWISGDVIFYASPTVPYSGGTGQTVSRKYVDDTVLLVSPTGAVNIYGDQTIYNNKVFISSPVVPTPTSATHAANKSYVDTSATIAITNVVRTSGSQLITGAKTFINSPIIPVATNPNQAVQKAQLDALGVTMGGVSGFAGVLTLNGTSGASGHVYLEGAGTVSLIQCGDVFKISGFTDISGLIVDYAFASVNIESGTFSQFVEFPGLFVSPPKVLTTVEVAQINSPVAITVLPSYITTSGFTANFSAQAGTGYVLTYYATTGSGMFKNMGTLTQEITQTYSIGNTWAGNWSPIISYTSGNIVYNSGSSYLAIQNNNNSNPTTGTNWQPIASGFNRGESVNITNYFRGILTTGSGIYECIIPKNCLFTGYSLGLYNLNTTGIITGSIYRKFQNNIREIITPISINPGEYFVSLGGFEVLITGSNRIGLDITDVVSGAKDFSVGLFGNYIL